MLKLNHSILSIMAVTVFALPSALAGTPNQSWGEGTGKGAGKGTGKGQPEHHHHRHHRHHHHTGGDQPPPAPSEVGGGQRQASRSSHNDSDHHRHHHHEGGEHHHHHNGKGSPSSTYVPPQVVSWEDLGSACVNPSVFYNQVAPSSMQIMCSSSLTHYVQSGVGANVLPTNLEISWSVVSDKYSIPSQGVGFGENFSGSGPGPKGSYATNVASKGATCMNYKEVTDVMTVPLTLTCDQIVSMKSGPGEYCASVIAQNGGNAKFITSVDTGNTWSSCPTGDNFVPGKGM